MPSADQIAQQILNLTEKLVACAGSGELEKFNQIQLERGALIDSLESQAIDVEYPEATRETLTRSRDLNNQLMKELSKAEQNLLDQKSELEKGLKMRKAYTNI